MNSSTQTKNCSSGRERLQGWAQRSPEQNFRSGPNYFCTAPLQLLSSSHFRPDSHSGGAFDCKGPV
eukprot:1522298-Prymnesium_polylepis.1